MTAREAAEAELVAVIDLGDGMSILRYDDGTRWLLSPLGLGYVDTVTDPAAAALGARIGGGGK